MFMSYLVVNKKVNPTMSHFQIFRIALVQLSEAEWNTTALNLNELEQESSQLSMNDYHANYDIVFIDSSGYLNICSKLDKTTFEKVKNEARICVNFLKMQPFDCLDKLFIKNYSFEMCYDSLIKISPSNNAFYSNIVEKTSSQLKLLEYFNNSYCVALESIKKLLFKAVEKRTSLIHIKSTDNIKVIYFFKFFLLYKLINNYK